MNRLLSKLRSPRAWLKDESGNVAMEAVIVFPVMMTMFLGAIDVGNALLVNKKVITASQVVADLLSRESSVSQDEIDDAIIAGRMALEPFATDSYGIDIVGILFTDDDGTPSEGWRDTFNMAPWDGVLTASEGLGTEDEGVLAVTVEYDYNPIFVSIFTETIEMRESAIVRGRDTPYVDKQS